MSDLHLPDYAPVYPVTKEVKPRQRKAKLPDWGIEQRGTAGQNQTSPEWNVKWVLNPLRANTLDLFLYEQAKTGAWFLWTPPAAEQGRFRCDDWTKQLSSCSIWEVQATFRQVFAFNLPELNASTGYFYLRSVNKLTPSSGTFALTGNDAQLLRSYPLYADSGVFAVTAPDAGLSTTHNMTANTGTFLLSGKTVILTQAAASTALTWQFPDTGNPPANSYRLYGSFLTGLARLSTTTSTGYNKDELLAGLTAGRSITVLVKGITHTGTVSTAAALDDAGTPTERVQLLFSVTPIFSDTALGDGPMTLTLL